MRKAQAVPGVGTYDIRSYSSLSKAKATGFGDEIFMNITEHLSGIKYPSAA